MSPKGWPNRYADANGGEGSTVVNSLSSPKVSISKTPTCLDSKLPNKGMRIFRKYGTLKENQLSRSQTLEGDTDIYRLLSRYTSFWAISSSKSAKQRYTGGFSTSLRCDEDQLLRAQQNPERDTDTVFTVTVYLFLATVRCYNSKLPNKSIPWIFRQFTVPRTKISY